MRIVTVTTLFPNSVDPKHGIFVLNRLKAIREQMPGAEFRVIAPVPWFPFRSDMFGSYAEFAKVPKKEMLEGFEVVHPRYLLLPKVGMLLTPFSMALSIQRALSTLKNSGFEWQLVDGHYLYPDGVALALLKAIWGVPLVLSARGTDVNLIPRSSLPRKLIQWASRQAEHLIGVCQALADEMSALGIDKRKISTLRNGVDLTLFQPCSETQREQFRQDHDLHGQWLLSVGHLIERKGHHLIIDALQSLPGVSLLLVGEGPWHNRLRQQLRALGLQQRVRFLGPLSQAQLVKYYCVADALVLASSREGWANVLLESMACGTPVVATRVWGTPEVVKAPEAGVLVERTVESIADGIRQLLAVLPERSKTRRYAEQFSWQKTAEQQAALYQQLVARG